ncbi:hypothetical protein [Leptospira kirschneri]|uniref:Uncharacterized protein n=1 Tax=Leptospira kirschneri serovar Pomona TaxID=561005 RepID=A0A1T1DHU1_9LEPT|nr:hypothetical protein [Leptospira kirschneri]KON78124.1 Uncharacterized protein NV38_0001140 [Leptospira kirschneri serovar Mozdok]KPZ78282.1 hypothetical protein APS47_05880 [Leptospira kirschneri serovar Mozdok]NDK05812.1 hypothetical protein [Leptospira kirschneri serovar Mozdok]OOV40455.1 hypothetical protein B1J93_17035 [Leptospira kirschneri serovar Pomona]OOV49500.1 hypothetical protein B1J94_05635 [Leptospira kirschneri serovar Grippotyphosa]
MSRKIQKRTLIVSIVLFGVSLFTPSLEELNFGTHREIMPGYLVLAWGWNSIAFFHPAWCANITWIVGNILFFKREYRASFCLSILTSLLSLDSYAYPAKIYLGFYLWNVAVNLPLAIHLVALAANRLKPKPGD